MHSSGCKTIWYAPADNPTAFTAISGQLLAKEEVLGPCDPVDESDSVSGAVYSVDFAGNYRTGTIGISTASSYVHSTVGCGSTPPAGQPYKLTSYGAYTSGGGDGSLALDGNLSTAWYAGSTSPASASFTLDMMPSFSVGSLALEAATDGFVGNAQVQVSADKAAWTTVDSFTGIAPSGTRAVAVGTTIRYVRIVVTNPGGAA